MSSLADRSIAGVRESRLVTENVRSWDSLPHQRCRPFPEKSGHDGPLEKDPLGAIFASRQLRILRLIGLLP